MNLTLDPQAAIVLCCLAFTAGTLLGASAYQLIKTLAALETVLLTRRERVSNTQRRLAALKKGA